MPYTTAQGEGPREVDHDQSHSRKDGADQRLPKPPTRPQLPAGEFRAHPRPDTGKASGIPPKLAAPIRTRLAVLRKAHTLADLGACPSKWSRNGVGCCDGRVAMRGMAGLVEVGVDGGSGAAGSEQLGQVVGGADQRPFVPDLAEAAQQELTEAARLLDLTDHRLDRRLAPPVARAPAGALEPRRHRRQSAARLEPPAAARVGRAAGGAARREIAADAARRERGEVVL